MTYRQLTRKLAEYGCYEIPRRVSGSHRKWYNPQTGKGTTIPDWGAKDLKLGTIAGICKQLGIDKQTL